jgi:hypothetical protein
VTAGRATKGARERRADPQERRARLAVVQRHDSRAGQPQARPDRPQLARLVADAHAQQVGAVAPGGSRLSRRAAVLEAAQGRAVGDPRAAVGAADVQRDDLLGGGARRQRERGG